MSRFTRKVSKLLQGAIDEQFKNVSAILFIIIIVYYYHCLLLSLLIIMRIIAIFTSAFRHIYY